MNSPLQWTKQVASHWGGTRNGTIVHWPNGIAEKGGLRSQFTHVIDVAPTILEAAGLPEPTMVNGVLQSPMEGTSMLYAFEDAGSPERHDLQYFEMFGNRGIYHKGWSAVTKHKTPWVMVGGDLPAFDDDLWELYDGSSDFSQAHDLAAENPEMLAKLQRLWIIEATKYNVLPIDDRGAERLNPDLAGRPTLIHGTSQQFFPGMGRLSENSVLSIKNKSFSVTADVDVPDGGVEGVIIAQGGRFGGWTVFVKDNRLTFVYNVLGIHHFVTQSDEPVPSGHHQLRVEFAYDGGGLAKGGGVTLYHDGTAVGTGRVELTQPMVFSADETTDIGYESGTTGLARLHRSHQPVHRQDRLGPARPRRRRPRPLHRPRGAGADRHGPPVSQAVDTRASGADDAAEARGGWSRCPRSDAGGRPAGSAGSSSARTGGTRP